MTKIVLEILKLLWKVFREVFWRWIKPMLGKIILIAVVAIAVISVAVFMAAC